MIRDEEVEAAARGVWAHFEQVAASNTSEPTAGDYATARAALEAAAPHLIQAAKAEAWDEGYDYLSGIAPNGWTGNPYKEES